MTAPPRRWKVRRATLAASRRPPLFPSGPLGTVVSPTSGSTAMERAALTLCDTLNAVAFHDTDSRRNPSGLPDVVAVVGSTLVMVEFKPAGRYPDPEQRRWLQALAGVTQVWTGVIRPADWPSFAAFLTALATEDE